MSQVPSNSADVDILIGEKIYTTQGAGPEALSILASRLLEQGDIPMIGLTSSRENTNAHKSFVKGGYKKSVEYSPDGFGECFLFALSLNQGA